MATSPAPDAAAPPGMCPGIAVLGGGGGSGDGDGSGNGNGDGSGGDGSGNGEGGNGDGKGGGACGKGGAGGCPKHPAGASAGDPVDVATGEMYTIPKLEFSLPGLVALDFELTYRSGSRYLDVGMGYGWRHIFAWEAKIEGKTLVVRKGVGGGLTMPAFPQRPGDEHTMGGWRIRRTTHGFSIRTIDDFEHELTAIRDPNVFCLTRVTHPNGAEFRIVRAPNGAIERIIDSVGREVCFTSNADGRVTQIHLTEPATGRTIIYARYDYDAAGNMVSAIDADGALTLYRYDDDHHITSLVYPSGLTFHYRYDSRGRCYETWGELPDGDESLDPSVSDVLADHTTKARGIFHTKLEFGDRYTEVVDSVRLIRYFVGPNGVIDKCVGAVGDVFANDVDEKGNVVKQVDPLGAVTTYEYDSEGRLIAETEPLGRTLRVLRDEEGRAVSTLDFGGGIIECQYDASGNKTQVKDPRGAVTTYRFDARNLMTEKVDPDGGVTRYVSDDYANLSEMHTPTGGVWRWTWDYFGRPVQRIDPRGGVTRYEYSDAGKLIGVEEPGGRRFTIQWDAMGCYTAWHLNEGVKGWRWGGLRWPVAKIEPNGDTVRYTYNREGWLLSVTNERGETARYDYSPTGLIRRFTAFDGRWEAYKRDALRRIIAVDTSAGEKYKFDYDMAGRLTAITYPDDTEYRCEYNENDDVIRATGPGVVVEQLFDLGGNVVEQSQEIQGTKHSVAAVYDSMNRCVGLRSTLGLDYGVHRAIGGEVRGVTLGAAAQVAIDTNAIGFPTAETLPGGGRIELEWDERLRLRMLKVSASRAAAAAGTPDWVDGPRYELAARYEYRPDDKLIRSRYNDRGVTDYQYDARGRLAERQPQQGARETFHFDEANNLFDARKPAQRRYAAGNRLVSDGDTTYRWDAAGRLVEKRRADGPTVAITHYAWNAQGLLSMVVLPDGTQVEFTYDPFFRRLEKAVFRSSPDDSLRLAKLSRYVWDGNELLHELTQVRGEDGGIVQEKRTFTRLEGASRLLAVGRATGVDGFYRPEAWTYCASDSLGTPVAMIDERGKVVTRWSLTAWGQVERADGDTPIPTTFPGQYPDEETGLVYNFHRYYDPEVGRYISPDPINLAGGLNLYAYCPDPVNYADRFGLAEHHQCSVSFQPGGSDTTYVPTSDSGRTGPNGNPVPGVQSGATNDDRKPATKTRPKQDATPRMIPGAQGSDGNTSPAPNKPYSNTAQAKCHTEQHAMEWAKTHHPDGIPGSKMNLGGQHPPCQNCNESMRKFTDTKPPAKIEYNWPVNNRVKYEGGQGPTAVPHNGNPPSADAKKLEAAHKAGEYTGYKNEYEAQMDQRRPKTKDGKAPNPNYDPSKVDRSQHQDDNEQFERREPGQPPNW